MRRWDDHDLYILHISDPVSLQARVMRQEYHVIGISLGHKQPVKRILMLYPRRLADAAKSEDMSWLKSDRDESGSMTVMIYIPGIESKDAGPFYMFDGAFPERYMAIADPVIGICDYG